MDLDPNRKLRATVLDQLRANQLDATPEFLDLLVDAVLDADGRDDAIDHVAAMADLPRGRATKLVDLAREALDDVAGGQL